MYVATVIVIVIEGLEPMVLTRPYKKGGTGKKTTLEFLINTDYWQ